MTDCIFCKIIQGDLPATIIYQDEAILAFDDIHPQAPVHKLIVPRKHIATVNNVEEGDITLLGRMIQTAQQLATDLKIADSGYRLIMNCNQDGGQLVYHIHLHLLGGRPLGGLMVKP